MWREADYGCSRKGRGRRTMMDGWTWERLGGGPSRQSVDSGFLESWEQCNQLQSKEIGSGPIKRAVLDVRIEVEVP